MIFKGTGRLLAGLDYRALEKKTGVAGFSSDALAVGLCP
jgi:hypothetical protein